MAHFTFIFIYSKENTEMQIKDLATLSPQKRGTGAGGKREGGVKELGGARAKNNLPSSTASDKFRNRHGLENL